MAVYLVSGKLGSGKSLACVGRIRDAIYAGRRIATNLDLRLEAMLPPLSRKARVVRVPDRPTVDDLDAIGLGTEEVDESHNGLLVLDELATWLNAREWGDKGRAALIDWFLHSRKKGWDVYLIIQDASLLDKQLRDALVEYTVTCRRTDRVRIPFLGPLISLITAGLVKGYLPRMHFGIVRYGRTSDSVVAERWIYLGRDLYAAYDTRQIFSPTYDRGVYSYLTPWHTVGLHHKSPWDKLVAFFTPPKRPPLKPPARLQPLLSLPPEVRWHAARALVERGFL